MPPYGFWTNRSRAKSAPFGPVEMSITLRPLTANAPQEAETGDQSQRWRQKLAAIPLVGSAVGHNLTEHKSASLKAAGQSRDKTVCIALWAHAQTNAFRHC